MRVPPRTTRPESGSSRPARIFHEGGLPSPLRPTADAVAFVQTDRDALKDGSGRGIRGAAIRRQVDVPRLLGYRVSLQFK